jgi:Zn-finger domain-containing protein
MDPYLSVYMLRSSFEVCLTFLTHLTIEVNVYSEALLDSRYIDDLDHIIGCFDKTTKPRFRDAREAQYIKFGSTRDNDAAHNIRFGQLKLFG